jgi:hypothetical protein
MADYITTDHVIKVVYGLLGSITVPKYLKTSPEDISASVKEYVVINALPINANVMQKCYVNVNYHVKDVGPGRPDHTKLEAGSTEVLAILKEVTATTYLIDFESQETIRESSRGEHYSNMRFSFKYINK